MSACPLLDRVTMINTTLPHSAPDHLVNSHSRISMTVMASHNGVANNHQSAPPPPPPQQQQQQQQQQLTNTTSAPSTTNGDLLESPPNLERDYYGCYCLKFIVKNGSHITEEKVLEDFGHFGEVVDVRGPGLFSGLRGNHVYVRFIDKADAEEALRHLASKYHQLTPASISDVLPDNYGLYTISFYNKTGIPSSEVRREFSKFGEVKNLTGSLDVKGGRVFVSYKEKTSAVQALQAFFFRKDKYPNMKFALPRCEKDYFGCYCLKFYNKSGDITEEKVLKDFGQFGEVVDVRGPGLFDVTGDDVYVRYKEKSSAEQALIELVGKYDSLCLAPPSDIQADKFGYYTITFVNDKCLSKSDVWYIFSKFGTVACVNGTFDCKKGRVFVSYKEKQGALNALETMLITKEYHLQVSKNSTVRKNDYNIASSSKDMSGADNSPNGQMDFSSSNESNGQMMHSSRLEKSSTHNSGNGSPMPRHHGGQHHSHHHHNGNGPSEDGPNQHQHPHMRNSSLHRTPPNHRDNSRSREASLVPVGSIPPPGNGGPPPVTASLTQSSSMTHLMGSDAKSTQGPPPSLPLQQGGQNCKSNGLVKFNRNVEKDIFGYFCLSFLNEDGDISEKKVRHDFGKFGEVVSVRGALGKQKGHVFVRFRKKEAAENCLNCLNSFPLSEMSELFGKYLFLSPATPRDIDCDMYGLYSISFLNLNMKTFREIRQEFAKFGEIVRLTSGGGGNTDELVSISYAEKSAAIKALQTHFTNKEYPYLDIAKGSSLLLVNSSDSSDNEENESDYLRRRADMSSSQHHHNASQMSVAPPPPSNVTSSTIPSQQGPPPRTKDPFHDPSPSKCGTGASDVVDELLKPLQSYFSIYRTGQYSNPLDGVAMMANQLNEQYANGHPPPNQQQQQQRSPDKKYRIKSVKNGGSASPQHNPNASGDHSPPQVIRHPMENGGNYSCPPPPIVTNGISANHPSLPTLAAAAASAVAANSMLPPPSLNVPPPRVGEPVLATTTSSVVSTPTLPSPESSVRSSREASEPRDHESYLVPGVNNEVDEEVGDDEEDLGDDFLVDENCVGECSPVGDPVTVDPDVFGLYSLSFVNRSKELTERKVRLDFGKYGDVSKIRGQFGNQVNAAATGSSSGSDSVVVSFADRDCCQRAVSHPALKAKYPSLSSAPPMDIVPDKDGHFSIEFVNSGMNGIREITNVFSRHGEVMKVMAGGAKNAVKRVTVSYSDRDSAFDAVRSNANSKDFLSVDFARECLFLNEQQQQIP